MHKKKATSKESHCKQFCLQAESLLEYSYSNLIISIIWSTTITMILFSKILRFHISLSLLFVKKKKLLFNRPWLVRIRKNQIFSRWRQILLAIFGECGEGENSAPFHKGHSEFVNLLRCLFHSSDFLTLNLSLWVQWTHL